MIPGITDKLRLQRLGKIRLGEKAISQRGAQYPKATDHFVFDEGAAAVAAVYEKAGEPCSYIYPVLFPMNPKRVIDSTGERLWDFTAFWQTSRSAYGSSSGLFCRCSDGQNAKRTNKGLLDKPGDPKHGKPLDPQGWTFIQENKLDVGPAEIFELPCPGEECVYFEKKMCKNLGSLDLVLPDVPGMGVWTIQTSSRNSIRNIESTLQQLAAELGGDIQGIPVALRLVPQQAQVEGKAKTIFVLEIICPHNRQQLAGLRQKALAAGSGVLALIEGKAPLPDDLYPHAGSELDKELKAAPAVPPKEETPVDVQRARNIGEALGMSKAQVEIAVRKAGDHIASMVDAWERDLEAKGGETAKDRARELMREDMNRPMYGEGAPGEGNPIFDEWGKEAKERADEPAQLPAERPAVYGSVSTGVGKSRAVREAEDRQKEEAKKEKAEAKKQAALIAPRDTTGSAYDV